MNTTKRVSAEQIRNLAANLQAAVGRIEKKVVPVEYIEGALRLVERDGNISLKQAEAVMVLPLITAKLAQAKENFLRRQAAKGTTIKAEVSHMFWDLGSRRPYRARMEAALPAR